MTPQNRAQLLLERENVEKIYAQMAILETVDVNLTDAGFRLLSLLRQKRVVDADVSLGYDEIAFSLTWSRAKTIRAMQHLLKLAFCGVKKQQNKRNCYTLAGSGQLPRTGAAPTAAIRCSRCKADRPRVDKVGVCIPCRKQETADKEVADYFEIHGVGEFQHVHGYLVAWGSKSGQKALLKAYTRVLDNLTKGQTA